MIVTIKKIPAGLKDSQYIIKTAKQTLYVTTKVYDALVHVFYQLPRAQRYECVETVQIAQYTFNLTKEKWEEIKPLYHQYTERR